MCIFHLTVASYICLGPHHTSNVRRRIQLWSPRFWIYFNLVRLFLRSTKSPNQFVFKFSQLVVSPHNERLNFAPTNNLLWSSGQSSWLQIQRSRVDWYRNITAWKCHVIQEVTSDSLKSSLQFSSKYHLNGSRNKQDSQREREREKKKGYNLNPCEITCSALQRLITNS
jgi:hypothetical protein